MSDRIVQFDLVKIDTDSGFYRAVVLEVLDSGAFLVYAPDGVYTGCGERDKYYTTGPGDVVSLIPR